MEGSKGALMLASHSLLVGDGPVIQTILKTISKVAQTDSTVLIAGESGTGKELVARAIHAQSHRSEMPMVVVNCGAIPGELLEAELFGHIKGAFTGATTDRVGRFEAAKGGTLFLDEIGEMPLHLQVKLLRVLQTRHFEPIGSSETKTADVRIIAATNRNLEELVEKRLFREDLFYRLNVIPVNVPPLRARKSDIPTLVKHFVEKINQITGHTVDVPQGEIMDALMAYDWPGNVRELENMIERIVILKGQGSVDLADLPHRIFRKFAQEHQPDAAGAVSEWDFPRMILPKQGLDLKSIVMAFENHLIDQALTRTSGNKNKASELLQMNRTTLVEKLRKRGMIQPAKKGRSSVEAESFSSTEEAAIATSSSENDSSQN